MARIKIEDLPVLEDLSPTETKGIFGGIHISRPYEFLSNAERHDYRQIHKSIEDQAGQLEAALTSTGKTADYEYIDDGGAVEVKAGETKGV